MPLWLEFVFVSMDVFPPAVESKQNKKNSLTDLLELPRLYTQCPQCPMSMWSPFLTTRLLLPQT